MYDNSSFIWPLNRKFSELYHLISKEWKRFRYFFQVLFYSSYELLHIKVKYMIKCLNQYCILSLWILMQLISPIISMFVPFINGSSVWCAPRQQCNYDGIIQKYLMNITRCQILQKLAFQCPGFTHNSVSSSRVSMTVYLIFECSDNSNDKKIHILYQIYEGLSFHITVSCVILTLILLWWNIFW